jgi:hypothetical protein
MVWFCFFFFFCSEKKNKQILGPKDLLNHFFGPEFSVANAAPWSESALVLHGVSSNELSSLIEPLYEKGAQLLRFVGGEFCGNHLIGDPDEDDAKKRAQEILSDLQKEDKMHHYRIREIDLKFVKVLDKSGYIYFLC